MDPSLLMTVLAQGEEQTRQLESRLDGPPLDTESCRSLARQVQSSFQTAIAMAKHLGAAAVPPPVVGSDSPGSESPRSDNSDPAVRDQEQRETLCKKRKSLPKWNNQVRVSLGAGIEGPLDDGYSWRKYGQKDILGAKFPRGYYRCTHRNSQGCLATKQVQRSDDDPLVFDVSYRGVHTCVEKLHKAQASQKRIQCNPSDSAPGQQNLLVSLQASLKVKTEGLEGNGGQPHTANSSSFSFPSTPMSCVPAQNNVFTNTFPQNFMSATVTESNYFSLSQGQTSNNYAAGQNVHHSESELTEIISAATSATNSPMLDIDFALGPGEFDPSFPFDGSNFF